MDKTSTATTQVWNASTYASLVSQLGQFSALWSTRTDRSFTITNEPAKLAFDLLATYRKAHKVPCHTVMGAADAPVCVVPMGVIKAVACDRNGFKICALMDYMDIATQDPKHPLTKYYREYVQSKTLSHPNVVFPVRG